MRTKPYSHRRVKVLRLVRDQEPSSWELSLLDWRSIKAAIDFDQITLKKGKWAITPEGQRILDEFESDSIDALKTRRYFEAMTQNGDLREALA